VRALAFAWRSFTRRRARSLLGILGIAAAGALMFDMLLLSRGLVVSLREMLDSFGYDVRVLATEGLSMSRAPLLHATATAEALAGLPEVAAAVPFRMIAAEAGATSAESRPVTIIGVGRMDRRPWTLLEGRDLAADALEAPEVVINRRLARSLGAAAGGTLTIRGRCGGGPSVRPDIQVGIAGIADFPFESSAQLTAAARMPLVDGLCEGREDEADVILVASRDESGPEATVAAIRRARPGLSAFSNDEVIERFERIGFSYFRQISAGLSVVTISFGILLITVLLTVSVNQRLGEIAALRAIGFTRWRAAADVLWESFLLVGLGGALAVPLGLLLSMWLDSILRSFPGVPVTLRFFVLEPRTLWLHGALLAAVAAGAAVYPVWLVARLPIAATLRKEIVS
jgi:putative ABC transport system permease protein